MSSFKVKKSTPEREVAAFTKYGVPYLWGTGDVSTGATLIGNIPAGYVIGENFARSRILTIGNDSFDIGGGIIVASSIREGVSYVYITDYNGVLLLEFSKLEKGITDTYFGATITVSNSGKILISAADGNRGSVFVFDRLGNQLLRVEGSPISSAPGRFGKATAIGCGKIAIGKPESGGDVAPPGYELFIYDDDYTLSNPTIITKSLEDSPSFISVGCGRIVYSPAFTFSYGIYVTISDLTGKTIKSLPFLEDFRPVSISVGCGIIAIGLQELPFGVTKVSIYDLDGNFLFEIAPPDTNVNPRLSEVRDFGYSIDIGCGRIVVGAPDTVIFADDPFNEGEISDSITYKTGAVFVYDLDGNLIETIICYKLEEPTKVSTEVLRFGDLVKIRDGRILIGAPALDPLGGGVEGDKIYIYETPNVYTPYDVIDMDYE
jgi:hypothetical protein